MTLSFRATLTMSLALLAVVAGCGDPSSAPGDMGPDQPDLYDGPIIEPTCDEFTVRYRITELHVPTAADVNSGAAVGHNVDRMGTACGVPDLAGGVDNSLIDFTSALPALTPPVETLVLQDAIDRALECPADADPSECTRLDLVVSVGSGTSCALIEIEDGAGATLAGPFVGSLNGAGEVRGTVSAFELTIPYVSPGGVAVDLELPLVNVILTAVANESALTDIVLGGVLLDSDFEAMLMEVLPLLGDEPTFGDVADVVRNLYDVQVQGQCSGLSVGFTGTATVEASP